MGKEQVVTIILVVFALLGAYYLIKNNVNKNKDIQVKNGYSVIIDAGGSSTTIYTFSYTKRIDDNSLVNLEEKGHYKKDGGIDEKTDLSSYFSELFTDSKNKIMNLNSSADLSSVPIFFKSYALRELSQSSQDTIISGIRNVIKNESPFLFKDEWAKITNETEEAFFHWISVNYISGVLKKNDDAKKQIVSTDGTLYIRGGAFTIGYVPNGEIKKNKLNFGLGHFNYDLFAYGLTGYGQDNAVEKLNDYVVSGAKNGETEITNPCFLKGYSEKYKKDQTKTLVGNANIEECEKIISSIIGEISKENSDFPDTTNVKFTAFYAYAYTSALIGVPFNEYVYPTEFYDKGKTYCSKTFEEIKKVAPEGQEKYINVYCFTSFYFYHLMVDFFKLNPKEKNVQVIEKINEVSPSLAHGAMAYEMSLLSLS